MRSIAIFACCVAIATTAHAQVRRCVDAKTKAVTLSDTACPVGTSSEKTLIPVDQLQGQQPSPIQQRENSRRSNPAPRQPQANGTKDRPAGRSECHKTLITEPQPFLGTAEEIIVFADGSVWKDLSYQYLYLYAYSPTVVLCPAEGKMILGSHEFQLMRIR